MRCGIELLQSRLRDFSSAADSQPNILKKWLGGLFLFLFCLLLSLYFLLNLRNWGGIAKEGRLILRKVKFSSQNMYCNRKRRLTEYYVKKPRAEDNWPIFSFDQKSERQNRQDKKKEQAFYRCSEVQLSEQRFAQLHR